jgi:hypothetical protein
MGSGQKAEAGWTKACFQKNLQVLAQSVTSVWENQNGSIPEEDPSKYDIKTFMNSGGP